MASRRSALASNPFPSSSGESPAQTGSTHTIVTSDGYELVGTMYRSVVSDTVVVINGATAVPQRFYRRFAEYVAQAGWTAVTYDYRGIGDSLQGSLRGFDATMSDWAFLDMTAAIDWVGRNLSPRRLFAVGHSFGGQVIGMIGNADRVDAMAGVSAQSGYWGVQGGREVWRARIAVSFLIPVLARLFGYFPWSRFASGADLPKGVALEWASWCRKPNYLLDDDRLPVERYRSFAAPVLAYSIEDDDWGTRRAVDAMMRAYPNVTRRHLEPDDYGLARLGHVGFFREGAEPLWRATLDWLDAQPPRPRQSGQP